MARVTLEGVRKVFEDSGQIAVHDMDLSVEDGEFVVLVGPSGCGKTTTLRMIAGLEPISAGRLLIGDRVVTDVPPKERDIAMVFQSYALYPHMSVYENMAFALRLRNESRTEIDTRVRRAAALLGLDDVLSRKPRQLSGGQRQRVAIGRAIVRDPQVFLFDEPLSNLDAKLRLQTRRELAALHRELEATMIYVTHDQVEAMTLGQRIVVMNAGYVQQIDTPLNLYNRPRNRFVATFIGSPAMSVIDGQLSGESGVTFRTAAGALVAPLNGQLASRLAAYVGKRVSLGIRPEDVGLAATYRGTGPIARLQARVDAVEPTGSDSLVYARTGDFDLTARLPADTTLTPGAPVELAVPLDRVHVFDGETGTAIVWPPYGA